MARFILRFVTSGRDAARDAIVERLHASPDVVLIEETPRMLLVEATAEHLRHIVDDSEHVVIVAERHYKRPNPPLNVENEKK